MEIGQRFCEKEKRQGCADKRRGSEEALGTSGPEALCALDVQGNANAIGECSEDECGKNGGWGRS